MIIELASVSASNNPIRFFLIMDLLPFFEIV